MTRRLEGVAGCGGGVGAGRARGGVVGVAGGWLVVVLSARGGASGVAGRLGGAGDVHALGGAVGVAGVGGVALWGGGVGLAFVFRHIFRKRSPLRGMPYT